MVTSGTNVLIALQIGTLSHTESTIGTEEVDPNVLVTGVG